MKRIFAITVCGLVLPGATLAATRTYNTGAFEGVSVAVGVTADISVGSTRSVLAETRAEDFDDLQISVKDNVLRIGRPSRNWFTNLFSFGRRPDYHVHVVTPALHSLTASSGAEVTVKGNLEGDFSVSTSSGSEVDAHGVKGGNVKVHASSGSEISIAGSCISIEASASSGSSLDADDLSCENASVHTSSGSDVSVAASQSLRGRASSGSAVRVKGNPPAMQVDTSSGASVARE